MRVAVPALGLFKKIKTLLGKPDLFFFFLFIIFINLPVVRLYISTNFISKVILLYLFIQLLLFGVKSKGKNIFFLLLFLIPATVSVVAAKNIPAFLLAYQNIIFSGLFFFIGLKTINKKDVEKIIYILVFSALINSIFEFFIYFNPSVFPGLLKNVLEDHVLNAINYYLIREKGAYDTLSQLLIPLLFYLFYIKKDSFLAKGFYIFFLFLIMITAVISNLRIYFLLSLFTLLGSTIIFWEKIKKKIFYPVIFFICFILLVGLVGRLNSSRQINIVDRLLLRDEESKQTLEFRLNIWNQAIEVGTAHPVIGVGLSNFPEYTESRLLRESWSERIIRKGLSPSYYYPHNIFFSAYAETGALGLISLLVILGFYMKQDWLSITKSKNYLKKILIISFWALIIFGFFNPTSSFKFLVYFWLFRLLIIKLEYE